MGLALGVAPEAGGATDGGGDDMAPNWHLSHLGKGEAALAGVLDMYFADVARWQGQFWAAWQVLDQVEGAFVA